MSLHHGPTPITAVFVGAQRADTVYVGAQQVWPDTTTATRQGDGTNPQPSTPGHTQPAVPPAEPPAADTGPP